MTAPLLPGLGGGGSYAKPNLSGAALDTNTSPFMVGDKFAKPAQQVNNLVPEGTTLNFGSSPPTPVSTPASTTLNSSSLAQPPSINYQSPVQPPIYPVAGLNSTDPASVLTETAPEKQANDLTTQLTDLNTRLVGESAAQTSNEAAQGVPNLNKDVTDLSAKLAGLKNESLAIPLQLQEASTGRGVTAAGLAPIQTGALRQNAIKSLSVASQLEATRGNLTTALDLADRATKQQYDPIREEIAAKTANLELILKSPAYSLADKKRAQAQLDLQNKKKQELDVAEENRKTIQGLGLQALQNGAPAAVVSQIMSAQDITSAFNAAQGYADNYTATSIQEYQFAQRNGYAGSFSQYQNEDANRKASIARAGVSNGDYGLSNAQATMFNGIAAKYNASPLIAAADRTIVLKNAIKQARANPSDGATQLNLVYSYIQALDTYQSAVREGELGLVNSIDSKTGALQNYVTKIQNGQIVRPEVAKQIADAAENIVNTINQGAKSKAASYKAQASTLGLGAAWDSYQSGFDASYNQPTQAKSQFSDIQSSLNIDEASKTAYIPRAVWSTLGSRQDALLAEAAADGYKLLVK